VVVDRGRKLIARLCVLTGFFLVVLAPPAFAFTDVIGEWHIQEQVFDSSGTPNHEGTNDYDFLTEDQSGNFAGTPFGLADIIKGQVGSGGSVVFSCTNGCTQANQPDYELYQGTLDQAGTEISGIAASCTNSNPHAIALSTWNATLNGSGATAALPPTTIDTSAATALCSLTQPTGPVMLHPTTTSDACSGSGSESGSATITCTATVSDGDTPAVTPTGTVSFSSSQGSFPAGSTCTLAAISSASGSPAACGVSFVAAGGAPSSGASLAISAGYSGDGGHAGSAASSASYNGPGGSTGGGGTSGTMTPPQPTLLSLGDCEDFANQPVNGPPPPPGTYTGAGGFYGTKAQLFVYCQQVAELALLQEAGFTVSATGASYDPLDPGPSFVHNFQTYIELPNGGWQVVAAQIAPWSQSQYAAYQAGVSDPPAPRYEVLASPARVRVPAIPVRGNAAARRTARILDRWLTALAHTRALADAFTTSVDRAGSARAAGASVWVGRQTRNAIGFAAMLVTDDTALAGLTRTVAGLAAKARLAHRGLSRRQLDALRARLVRHGLSAAERARLRALGYDDAAIAALLHAARQKHVTNAQLLSTPAALLGDPHLLGQLRGLALFFRTWPQQPSVLADAALAG
jgi:hypothetical protein